MNNPSVNKEVVGIKKFIDLKANTEKTIVWPAGIRAVQIIAPLQAGNTIRINSDGQLAANDIYSNTFNSDMSYYEVIKDNCVSDISLLSNVDITVQLASARTLLS